jgi:hypothetical protein
MVHRGIYRCSNRTRDANTEAVPSRDLVVLLNPMLGLTCVAAHSVANVSALDVEVRCRQSNGFA